jgi:hypothetical protein
MSAQYTAGAGLASVATDPSTAQTTNGASTTGDPKIAMRSATEEDEASLLAQAASIEAEGFTIEEGHYLACVVLSGNVGCAELHPDVFTKLARRGLVVGYKPTPLGQLVNDQLKAGELLPMDLRPYVSLA